MKKRGPPHQLSQQMIDACIAGNLATIRTLLEEGEDVDAQSREHETALTYAIVWNRSAAVELLLQSGADPDAPHDSRWSPLMYAANEGSARAVELILAAGSDTSRRDDHGRTAEDIAAKFPEVVELIRRSK